MILSTGPLTKTDAPGSVWFDITALSPKAGIPTSSNCGGNFGLHLKKAGYDALILSGRCRTHRWLEIFEDRMQHCGHPCTATAFQKARIHPSG